MTQYIVFRRTGTNRDGVWYDRMPFITERYNPAHFGNALMLKGIGVYETREDGALAEVYTPNGERTNAESIEAALNKIRAKAPGSEAYEMALPAGQREILIRMFTESLDRAAVLNADRWWAQWILDSPVDVTVVT